MARLPCPSKDKRNCKVGESLHSDLCFKFDTESLGGSKYFMIIKDEVSAYRCVYFLNTKDQAPNFLKDFIIKTKREISITVKWLRTDQGTEYCNENLKVILEELGIEHEITPPYTPQPNGIIERDNRTIKEKARTMLLDANLPIFLWAEAVNCAVYLMNRISRRDATITPFEQWTGRKPKYSLLKVYGCDSFVHIPKVKRSVWDSKIWKGYLVGYQGQSLFRIARV